MTPREDRSDLSKGNLIGNSKETHVDTLIQGPLLMSLQSQSYTGCHRSICVSNLVSGKASKRTGQMLLDLKHSYDCDRSKWEGQCPLLLLFLTHTTLKISAL